MDVDELLSFYVDNAKTHAADVASDAAPRKQAPTPTQPELSDGLAELSAVSRTDADGIICYVSCLFLVIFVFILQLQLCEPLKSIALLESRWNSIHLIILKNIYISGPICTGVGL